jgi:4-carboxymuconolactone decarboxylase
MQAAVMHMRVPLLEANNLSPTQRPIYDDMRAGIEENFRGFQAIGPSGALLGPWNPWLHEPKFGRLYAHVIVTKQRGLADDKLATIVAGQRPINLTAEEAIAYDVASALVRGGVLAELNYRQAVEAFGERGAAELIYLVGLYCLVSVTLNGFDVPVPEKNAG